MIYAIVNMKGGVGKTTTAVNLGAALARRGKSILVVDLDPQANATGWIGSGSPPAATVANALSDRKATPAAVGPSTAPGVDLAYGSRDLAGVAEDLRASSPTPALALRAALKQLRPYDAVLIDCPPGLGLLSLNAMIAADSLIVPVDSQSMALAGVAQIRETLAELADAEVISEIPPARILLTMYDGRLSLDRAVGDHLRENGLPVFKQAIRTNTKLAESYGLRQTIFEYAPTSPERRTMPLLLRRLLPPPGRLLLKRSHDAGEEEELRSRRAARATATRRDRSSLCRRRRHATLSSRRTNRPLRRRRPRYGTYRRGSTTAF